MKTKIPIGLIAVGLILSILTSCNNPVNNNKTTEKELELQKRELDLKQKEPELKEKELAEQSKNLIDTTTKITKPKTDPVSTNKSKYTASGIIKSIEYERNDSWAITIETSNSSSVLLWLNPLDYIVAKETEKLDKLKEGSKIGVIGKWDVSNSGKKSITVEKFDIL